MKPIGLHVLWAVLLVSTVIRAGNLVPGTTDTLVFKQLPQTLWSLGQPLAHKKPPALSFYLPLNYNPNRNYPLVVYMGGFRGESGHDTNAVRNIMGNQDFILVSMPLFKNTADIEKHADMPNIHKLAVTPDQSTLLWAAYQPMLRKLFDTIPNIDLEHTFFGGFSNGAHATAALLNDPNAGPGLRRYFNSFYFVEGGNYLRLTASLPDAALLFMQGETRAPWLEKTSSPLKWNVRIGVEVRTMPGIGHAFPAAEKKWLRNWIRSQCGL